jgi:hypothetical protein
MFSIILGMIVSVFSPVLLSVFAAKLEDHSCTYTGYEILILFQYVTIVCLIFTLWVLLFV